VCPVAGIRSTLLFGFGKRSERLQPPIEPRPDELVLIREPYAARVLLILPSGDSYQLTSEEAVRYLTRLGCPESERIIDFVWSFYSVWIGTLSWHFVRVSRTDAYRAIGEYREETADVSTGQTA